ncbi:MAG: UDP-4-amino-4,6-dideoxy-N-acetyl-beta-L-altrosamine transaminase [Oscillospiraceae bacterium]
MEQLAIFGGVPVRKEKIYYGRQWIDEDDIQAVADTLRSPLITQGPNSEQLEKDLCKLTGAKYAACIANGTAALHVSCLACGITSGDEVITTPMTFAASANCALYCGARPVFADINPETYNIDPESIRKCITSRTKAVVAVDFTGQVVEIDKIREICDEFGLILIEDAAHSIASKYNGRPVGSLADITTFSFHPVKTITGGEGGAILTDDSEIYKKVCLFRTHGITHEPGEMACEPDGPWYYEQIELGYNYRITDFQAALISSQLTKIDKFAARRKQIVRRYNETFAEIPEIIIQKEIPESDSCRHLYIIQLNIDKLSCTRKQFFDAMCAENIVPQVHYIPVYYFPYYKRLGYKKGLCPNAEAIYENIMSLPLYPMMTDEDVNDAIAAVKKAVDYYKI